MSYLRVPVLLAVILVGQSVVTADTIPNDRDTVLHALNRLTFGPGPDDVERVQRMGLAAWIDQQLNPSRINDSAVETHLSSTPAPPASFSDPKEARRAAREDVLNLAGERLTRAVYSDRQLEEVLVDFWFNHFNVYAGKGRTAEFVRDYENEAIRPYVFGKFRDLLGATAHHPAMLFYLDNWMSVDPDAAAKSQAPNPRSQNGGFRNPRRRFQFPRSQPQAAKGQAANRQAKNKRRGLNENYGRELLELHTLGVDGGYTQKDVTEVARAFTGWTIAGRGGVGQFQFAPRMHDAGKKVVLGHTIPSGGGIKDGETVLDIVASHPSTAHHIAYELAQRFVSDEPPQALVDRAAARFMATGGDLREVVRTIITSPEFFAADARRAKIKTPLEFVVSAVRATGDQQINPMAMARGLKDLGMPLYMCQPPTGYDNTADAWVGAGALVTRINLASKLAGADATLVSSPDFQRR
jgi:uncharacterized protein (DUF1800 family)